METYQDVSQKHMHNLVLEIAYTELERLNKPLPDTLSFDPKLLFTF